MAAVAGDDVGYDSHEELNEELENEEEEEEEDEEGWNHVEDFVRKDNPDLPHTVTVLEDDEPFDAECINSEWNKNDEEIKPGKVYLVGTAHFSTESQDDVRKTIQETQPDVVMVELCSSRVAILSMDEEKLLDEAKHLNREKIMSSIRQSGLVQGVMYCLMLSMSAHITKQLGMAPGGEFRAAFQEAQQVPGCRLHLGDRPIQVTLQRAFGSLSIWQKLRLIAGIIWSHGVKITKEDIEKAKQRDLLEEVLREMAGEFPELSKIFVQERDQYMAHVLRCLLRQSAAKRIERLNADPLSGTWRPVVVVGVIGIGHVPGIVDNWKCPVDVNQLLEVPEKSKWPHYTMLGVKGLLTGLLCYSVYCGGVRIYNYLKS